jgi:hypothetical protein
MWGAHSSIWRTLRPALSTFSAIIVARFWQVRLYRANRICIGECFGCGHAVEIGLQEAMPRNLNAMQAI